MTSPYPSVSVLIPSYNLRFFEEALQSAVNQDYENLEIIVCDDSSGPEIAGICKRIGDRRVIYEKNSRNLGFAGNFTECFRRAGGKYIKFLNDDDLLLPSCVSRMVGAFERHGNRMTLATSRRRVINELNEICDDIFATMPLACVTSYMEGEDLGDFVLEQSINFIGEPTTVMFRKQDIDIPNGHLFMLGGKEYLCLADLSLWLRLLSKGGAVYFAEPLSLVRDHSGQEQRKDYIAEVRWIEERLSLVLDARAIGFLKSPESYDRAMVAVAKLIRVSLSSPSLLAQEKQKVEELRRRIPAQYIRAADTP